MLGDQIPRMGRALEAFSQALHRAGSGAAKSPQTSFPTRAACLGMPHGGSAIVINPRVMTVVPGDDDAFGTKQPEVAEENSIDVFR